MAYCWSKHYSQKRRDFPTLYIRGHVCQMAGKAALGIFPLHRLLQRHSPAALSLQSALDRMLGSIPVLSSTTAKGERNAAGRLFSKKDPGGSERCIILIDLELLRTMKVY